MSLLTVGDANPKTAKSAKLGYLTAVLHLAPGDLSGYTTCPLETSHTCREGCLNKAGRGGIVRKGETTNPIQEARIKRTRWFFEEREAFMRQLVKEISAHIRKATRYGLTPCIRLNGTSDIAWEKIRVAGFRNIMEAFPNVQFYDYTKIPGRTTPENYFLTFSRSASNEAYAFDQGRNVSVVFGDAFPSEYHGLPVIDGDDHDLRFLDPKGCVVGLKAKGPAKKDASGFVVRS